MHCFVTTAGEGGEGSGAMFPFLFVARLHSSLHYMRVLCVGANNPIEKGRMFNGSSRDSGI